MFHLICVRYTETKIKHLIDVINDMTDRDDFSNSLKKSFDSFAEDLICKFSEAKENVQSEYKRVCTLEIKRKRISFMTLTFF